LPAGHDKVRRRLEDAYPDRELVGWYHTHPNCAPRFSRVDADEQATWNDPGHVGIVYSGVEPAEPFGVYRGPDASLLRRRTDVVPGEEQGRGRDGDAQEEPAREPEPPAQPATPARVPTQAPNPNGARSNRRRRLKAALLYLVLLLLVCLLGGLYWLHYRVQSVEARLGDMAAERARNASADSRPEQPRDSAGRWCAAGRTTGSARRSRIAPPL
jgi:hypothetical protein